MDRLLRAFLLANKHNKTQIVPGVSRAAQPLTSGGPFVTSPLDETKLILFQGYIITTFDCLLVFFHKH
jgi:hypothetical protein